MLGLISIRSVIVKLHDYNRFCLACCKCISQTLRHQSDEGKFRVMEVESITTYSQLTIFQQSCGDLESVQLSCRLGYDYTVRFIVPILLYLRYITV